MRKNKRNNKGFSLVELVIVVAILAILVGILAPQYTKYVERSRKSSDASNVENFVTAIKVAAADQSYNIVAGTYTVKLDSDECTLTVVAPTGSTGYGDIDTALKEYIGTDKITGGNGTYTSTAARMKSQKWGADAITVEIKVEPSGAVAVTKYAPDAFAEYMATAKADQ